MRFFVSNRLPSDTHTAGSRTALIRERLKYIQFAWAGNPRESRREEDQKGDKLLSFLSDPHRDGGLMISSTKPKISWGWFFFSPFIIWKIPEETDTTRFVKPSKFLSAQVRNEWIKRSDTYPNMFKAIFGFETGPSCVDQDSSVHCSICLPPPVSARIKGLCYHALLKYLKSNLSPAEVSIYF